MRKLALHFCIALDEPFAIHGWPSTLTDEQILERLVALNAERVAEEARGLIRWLRPEFQNPASGQRERPESAAVQQELVLPEEQESGAAKGKTKAKKSTNGAAGKLPWPTEKERAERTKAIQGALAAAPLPLKNRATSPSNSPVPRPTRWKKFWKPSPRWASPAASAAASTPRLSKTPTLVLLLSRDRFRRVIASDM